MSIVIIEWKQRLVTYPRYDNRRSPKTVPYTAHAIRATIDLFTTTIYLSLMISFIIIIIGTTDCNRYIRSFAINNYNTTFNFYRVSVFVILYLFINSVKFKNNYYFSHTYTFQQRVCHVDVNIICEEETDSNSPQKCTTEQTDNNECSSVSTY